MARYLHPVREAAVRQYLILKENIKKEDTALEIAITSTKRMHARFGRPGIRDLNSAIPLHDDSPTDPVLKLHPDLSTTEFVMPPWLTTTIKTIIAEAHRIGRPMHDSVYEWARLNPEEISKFFSC